MEQKSLRHYISKTSKNLSKILWEKACVAAWCYQELHVGCYLSRLVLLTWN